MTIESAFNATFPPVITPLSLLDWTCVKSFLFRLSLFSLLLYGSIAVYGHFRQPVHSVSGSCRGTLVFSVSSTEQYPSLLAPTKLLSYNCAKKEFRQLASSTMQSLALVSIEGTKETTAAIVQYSQGRWVGPYWNRASKVSTTDLDSSTLYRSPHLDMHEWEIFDRKHFFIKESMRNEVGDYSYLDQIIVSVDPTSGSTSDVANSKNFVHPSDIRSPPPPFSELKPTPSTGFNLFRDQLRCSIGSWSKNTMGIDLDFPPVLVKQLGCTKPYFDYAHLNSIDVTQNHIFVSSRTTSRVYVLDAATGSLQFALGTATSSHDSTSVVPTDDPKSSFYGQHTARYDSGELSVFDNHNTLAEDEPSRVVVYAFDAATHQPSLRYLRSFNEPNGRNRPCMGSFERAGEGKFIVGWGCVKRTDRDSPQRGVSILNSALTKEDFYIDLAPGFQVYRALHHE